MIFLNFKSFSLLYSRIGINSKKDSDDFTYCRNKTKNEYLRIKHAHRNITVGTLVDNVEAPGTCWIQQ